MKPAFLVSNWAVLYSPIGYVSLGAVGTTVELHENPSLYQGDDKAFAQLVTDMNAGKVAALIVDGINPSYHAADVASFNAGLDKVGFSVSTALFADETGSRCTAMLLACHGQPKKQVKIICKIGK